MSFPAQLKLKKLLQSMRVTMLVTAILSGQLVGCGGGGGGSNDVTTSDSIVSSASASSSSEPVSSDSIVSSASASSGSEPVSSGEDATGSFTLNWTAPATRSDGTPLSLADIDGYRIYYGDSQGYYPNSVDVNDGSLQSVIVDNVPVGSYYVVMTTYDVNGLESAYSSSISKNVY
jgi:hypothetical protein